MRGLPHQSRLIGEVIDHIFVYKSLGIWYFLTMGTVLDENPVRQKILLFLKKSGGMTVDALSSDLKITPMGVRQHLAALERKNLIIHKTLRQGVGRPGFLYKLSENAEEFFPRQYGNFALDILTGIEHHDGRRKVDELLGWRKEKILNHKKQILNGDKTIAEKISMMVEILEKEGYIADMEEDADRFIVRQYNCPISAVSKVYPEACKHELDLYRELFDTRVERTKCLSKGDNMCEYILLRNGTFSERATEIDTK